MVCLGTCFGKFTKTKKFRLHITALDFLAPYASHKVWLKSSAEQQFLYGHNVNKSGLGRITEDTDKYQGSMEFLKFFTVRQKYREINVFTKELPKS